MKRSGSPDYKSEAKRFDPYQSAAQFQQNNHQKNKQQMHMQQQQQIIAQHQQIHAAQQQQQQIQMQHQLQQQQQYGSSPQYYNQASYFPISPVTMPPPYANPAAPMMFNSSPSWNFMSTPPPFFNPSKNNSASSQPPLPPPDSKPEKPPLPTDPEPALGLAPHSFNAPSLRAPGSTGGLRIRGVNALNGAIYNGFNGGPGGIRGPPPIRQPPIMSANGVNTMNSPFARMRRRNPHHFPAASSYAFFNDMSHLNEEDKPAGPEKVTIILNDSDRGQIQVNKKSKRKPMSSRYSRAKEWVREDAEKALALEKEYSQASKRQMLILKFPDPDLNKFIVKKYSPFIETVHFQQPSTPRYCFVQLRDGADVDKVIETLNEIPFGAGKVIAERKLPNPEEHVVAAEEIDPYTLYIGNLPTTISVKSVKQHFPNALRIDIGYAQRMRYTRYAFIRYNSVEESMKAYKNSVNALFESRSLIVRFRRQKGNIGLPGEAKSSDPHPADRGTQSSNKPKPWDDADNDEYHEDEEVFLMNDIEEDDDDIIEQDDEALNAIRNNRLQHGMMDSKVEIDKGINEEAERLDKANDRRKKQKEGIGAANKLSPQETSTPQASTNNKNKTTTPSVSQKRPNETLDMKDGVLVKALQLLSNKASDAASTRSKSESPDCICMDSPDKPRKVNLQSVKVENSDDESSSDIEGINLLGTRVKDEFAEVLEKPPSPTMDDIYLDDYEYDMDGEPEEEDDDWADTSQPKRSTNWEEIRRRELSEREDKPDLAKLENIDNSLSSSTKVLPIVANLEPKNEFEKLYNARQVHNIGDTLAENDDLHDLFAEMNSDMEEEDDEQF